MSELTKALAVVQTKLPAIHKGKTAKVKTKSGADYSYSYADLSDISPVVLPLLGAEGLAWLNKPTYDDGRFVLVYKLRHVSGEVEEGTYPLPDPTTSSAQEIGSALTYARRYALCSVIGIAPDEDDDGNLAQQAKAGSAKKKQESKPVEPTFTKSQMEVKRQLEAVGDEGRKALAAWWEEQKLPKTHELSEQQASAVLAQVGNVSPPQVQKIQSGSDDVRRASYEGDKSK